MLVIRATLSFPQDLLEMTRTVKIAVVGTGLAGLTAAHLLKKQFELEGASESADSDVEFEVHIFEKVRFFLTFTGNV